MLHENKTILHYIDKSETSRVCQIGAYSGSIDNGMYIKAKGEINRVPVNFYLIVVSKTVFN
jgi:hypothetical protein